jgi:hypothetical protein
MAVFLNEFVTGKSFSLRCDAAAFTMSPKRGKRGVSVTEQRKFSLLDLPHTALALVAEHSKTRGAEGHPLLQLSRGCRDAVFSQSKEIRLDMHKFHYYGVGPAARLLNRACCTAPAGLHLHLDLPRHYLVLGSLLRPALDREAGWPNVHRLTVSSGSLINV